MRGLRAQRPNGRQVVTAAGSVTGLVLATALTAGPAHGAQAPAASGAQARAAGSAGRLGFTVTSAAGTAQGPALTAALPGAAGDYARLHTLGTVGVTAPDGRTLWQRSAGSLYADWHATFAPAQPTVDPAPQVPTVTSPVSPASPQTLGSGDTEGDTDVHPVAAGYLAGSRVPVVAVAETAGIAIGGNDLSPFTVPGSGLHYGTFVTVLNGRTGQTLYHLLDPGYVTQLAITGGKLVIGDETGYPLSALLPLGAWRSVTTVRALSFRPAARGQLTASTAWTFSTHAPWAAVLGLQPAGAGLAISWSDTPEDLGEPGPPGGHVVMVDGDGRVRWNVATRGYPVLSGYDGQHRLLVVAEQTDPTMGIGYTLAGLRPSDGSVAVSLPVHGVLPTALSVSSGTWYTGAIVTTLYKITGGVITAGQVSAVDPVHRRVLWTATLTGARGNEPFPEAVLAAGADVVVDSNVGPSVPTPADPVSSGSDLRALSAAAGRPVWRQSGTVAGPMSVRLAGSPGAPRVTGITDDQDAVSYSLRTGAVTAVTPLLGDVTTAVPARIGGRRVVIAGSQSGGVYALDASDLSRVRWQSYAGGAVHQISLAGAGGPAELVVAATNRVDVMDLETGRIRFSRSFPGQFVWNAAVGTIGGGRPAVVVATDRLTAFDARTGRLLWTYRPAAAAYFSDAVIVDGTTVAEYESQAPMGLPPATMAAVGIGPSGRVAWTATASTSTTTRAVLDNGVFASPGIAGAGATGVALAWKDGGSGRVDVRNAVTGKLHYSVGKDDLGAITNWAIDPRLGLVAVGAGGSVLIRPGHAVADQMRGSSATFVTTAGRTDLVVGATDLVQAFPATDLASGGGTRLGAGDTTYASGTVVPVGSAAGTSVLSMPTDSMVAAVVQGTEQGLPGGLSFAAPVVNGLTMLTLTATPGRGAAPGGAPASAPKRAAPKPDARQRPASVSVGAERPGLGLAEPRLEVKVHGYTPAGRAVLAQTVPAEGAPAGYGPATIGGYLHLTGDGAGQTVAVVDAYTDPDITADVNTFSGQFGLPRVCGTAGAGPGCFHFTITAPQGTPASNDDWALETSLDIEWIHAIAPEAKVTLVEARNNTFARLFGAVTSAAALHPDAVSLSWGSDGEFSGESYYGGACALTRSVCVAASGDDGYPGGYPAYDPDVVAVGGTTLNLTAGGTVTSETDWDGSGGGQSFFEAKPAAQRGVAPGAYRGIPDVSFDADPATGVAVYDSVPYQGQTGWFEVGGTSLGAPSWSAILASADQLRAAAGKPRLTAAGGAAGGGAQRAIYSLATGLARVTSGPPNGSCPVECQPGAGYDFITGLGSPRAGIDEALAGAP